MRDNRGGLANARRKYMHYTSIDIEDVDMNCLRRDWELVVASYERDIDRLEGEINELLSVE